MSLYQQLETLELEQATLHDTRDRFVPKANFDFSEPFKLVKDEATNNTQFQGFTAAKPPPHHAPQDNIVAALFGSTRDPRARAKYAEDEESNSGVRGR